MNYYRQHAPVPIPKVWFTQNVGENQPGIIVMEDLSVKGTVANVLDSASLGQVMSVAEALASLHAYSLQNKGELLLTSLQVTKIKLYA